MFYFSQAVNVLKPCKHNSSYGECRMVSSVDIFLPTNDETIESVILNLACIDLLVICCDHCN